jgi:hypothetical protein
VAIPVPAPQGGVNAMEQVALPPPSGEDVRSDRGPDGNAPPSMVSPTDATFDVSDLTNSSLLVPCGC